MKMWDNGQREEVAVHRRRVREGVGWTCARAVLIGRYRSAGRHHVGASGSRQFVLLQRLGSLHQCALHAAMSQDGASSPPAASYSRVELPSGPPGRGIPQGWLEPKNKLQFTRYCRPFYPPASSLHYAQRTAPMLGRNTPNSASESGRKAVRPRY